MEKLPAGDIRRHGIFVFAEHRKYLDDVRTAFLEYFDEDEIYAPEIDKDPAQAAENGEGAVGAVDARDKLANETSILRGGVAKEELKRARRFCHVVITTYWLKRASWDVRGRGLSQNVTASA